jgi:hypothetical protein
MVRAAALAGGGTVRAKFDASGFFEQAIDREIVALAIEGWRGPGACEVARHCAATADFPELLAVVEMGDLAGRDTLEVEVYGPDALKWLREHRPDIVAGIESVTGRGSCDFRGLDRGPRWDHDSEWDGCYEHRRGDLGPFQSFR